MIVILTGYSCYLISNLPSVTIYFGNEFSYMVNSKMPAMTSSVNFVINNFPTCALEGIYSFFGSTHPQPLS